MECRKETAYALHKTPITKTIREKEYQFLITTAHCKECGCEVGVKGILDYNAKEIDRKKFALLLTGQESDFNLSNSELMENCIDDEIKNIKYYLINDTDILNKNCKCTTRANCP